MKTLVLLEQSKENLELWIKTGATPAKSELEHTLEAVKASIKYIKGKEKLGVPIHMYMRYVNLFNETFNRRFDYKNNIAPKQLGARIKDGLDIEDIIEIGQMIYNSGDFFHKNPQYFTPEYLTRSSVMGKWKERWQASKKEGSNKAYPLKHRHVFPPKQQTIPKREQY